MDTLIDRVEYAAAHSDGRGIRFVTGEGEEHVSYFDLHAEARSIAADLQARGIGVGSHVALLGPTTRPLVTTLQAVWLTGATLVMIPLPMRLGSIDQFAKQTRTLVAQADIDLMVVDADLAPFLATEPGDPPSVLLDELDVDAATYVRPDVGPDHLAGLQFTSGSTADPKGVMLPHGTCCANLDALIEGAGIDPDRDVMVSWLPLYHDMGLVGFLMLPMTHSVELVLGAPQDFLATPARWMQWISAHRGTVTAGPNFSWVLAARALRRADSLDLSNLRLALNGAEPVDRGTVAMFVAAAERFGFDPLAVFPAFGMAELVVGGTFPALMTGLRTDVVDRVVLESERYAAPTHPDAETARHLALLGTPVPGLEMRIADPDDGHVLADREVGQLEIRGSSVTPGYYNRPDVNAELFTDDGWFRTGDLAYTVDGEMVMCGRIKDLIIVGGRNVFPDDIERAVGRVDGVRAGNVVAFGHDGRQGKEELVVVAETKADDSHQLRAAINGQVREAVGLPAKRIVLVAPGSLPKTSSGKLQRHRCKQQFAADELAVIDLRDPVSDRAGRR